MNDIHQFLGTRFIICIIRVRMILRLKHKNGFTILWSLMETELFSIFQHQDILLQDSFQFQDCARDGRTQVRTSDFCDSEVRLRRLESNRQNLPARYIMSNTKTIPGANSTSYQNAVGFCICRYIDFLSIFFIGLLMTTPIMMCIAFNISIQIILKQRNTNILSARLSPTSSISSSLQQYPYITPPIFAYF